jgi:hypothetical protein
MSVICSIHTTIRSLIPEFFCLLDLLDGVLCVLLRGPFEAEVSTELVLESEESGSGAAGLGCGLLLLPAGVAV